MDWHSDKLTAVSSSGTGTFLTLGAIARLLEVHPSTVVMLVKKGTLPDPEKVGGLRLFRRSDVNRWLRKREACKECV